jgi:transposase
MRATRDLLRRRCHLRRQRADLLAHLQNTNRQSNLPEIGKTLAYKANREGVEEPCPAPSVRKTIAVDLRLIDHYDKRLGDLELSIPRTATGHDGQTFARLQSVPGLGQSLALGILDEIQAMARFPRVQDCVSSCRLVKCAKESAGKRLGSSGKKSGNPQLQWAFSEAAVVFLRQNHPGKAYFGKLARNHGKGKALTVLAHQLARAGYDLLRQKQALDLQRFVTA